MVMFMLHSFNLNLNKVIGLRFIIDYDHDQVSSNITVRCLTELTFERFGRRV